MKRREFIQTTAVVGALTTAAGLGLLPRSAHAARDDAVFLETDPDKVLNAVFGTTEAVESADLTLDAPLQAENGAVVPVKINAGMADLEKIAIVVKKNPTPLLTVLDAGPRSGGFYSLRIKMGGTDKVYAYAQAGGKLYVASQDVRVAVGGCGG